MKPPTALEAKMIEQIKGAGLSKGCRREALFHPTRLWRFDLCWPELKLAVEVEGGTWVGGFHGGGAQFDSDATKYGEAAVLGWWVLRVSSSMIRRGTAIDLIARLHDRLSHPPTAVGADLQSQDQATEEATDDSRVDRADARAEVP